MPSRWFPLVTVLALVCAAASPVSARTTIRIMPPDGAEFAVGQLFDIRVEAQGDGQPPSGLRVFVDDVEVTARNILDPGPTGVRGEGGTGATDPALPAQQRADKAPPDTTNFLLRDQSFTSAGPHTIRAVTADGAGATVTVTAADWGGRRDGAARARNIIFFLGDGMGLAHRTAARVVSRGVHNGKNREPLAMDTLEVTGLVMTPALNSVITDSAPGMAAYSTGNKANNNHEGVYPDNTIDPFDNPRVEYIGAMLRRTRGPGFGVGIVTTADVTDATPAANAVHTSSRSASAGIAARFFDEREKNGVKVLLGGGARHFVNRADGRDLRAEFVKAGYTAIGTGTELRQLLAAPTPPERLLGLFAPAHLNVAFDKVGAGRYSSELAERRDAPADQPMLDEMARLAIRSLDAHSPAGFYLLVEGASIDKQAHAVDAERTIWDTIDFDNAVQAALEFADRTNSDDDPDNDTLVIVTADHETGGLGIVAVGNEHYAPTKLGKAVRDYAAVFRFAQTQILNFEPNYEVDERGFPVHPDPTRKLLLGWAAAPDRYENWLSNRRALDPAVAPKADAATGTKATVANPLRDGPGEDADNRSVEGMPVPGFLVPGVIENGELGCRGKPECPGDISSEGHTISGHTGSDVPLSATGPGALQFTGTYENTAVFVKMLRASSGSYPERPTRTRSRAAR
ncbi:MAG TPA: alkaline phosphatase [Vicinamibacterales bacterium]